MKSIMLWIVNSFLLTACCALFVDCVNGCSPNPQVAAIQAKAEVSQAQVKADTQTKVTAIQANAAVAQAQAKASPIAHPLAATTHIVIVAQHSLLAVFLFAFVALGVSIGLLFTPLSAISKIAVPVAGSVSLLSFTGMIALPFTPWILLGLVLAGIGIGIYELDHLGLLPKFLTWLKSELVTVEEDFHFASPPAATVALPAAASPISQASVLPSQAPLPTPSPPAVVG